MPLSGVRVLVTDFDLQQKEHRGIAVYSKGLLRALKVAGAETWLLTDFQPAMRDKGLKSLPPAVRRLIFSSRVLEALMIGPGGLKSRWSAVKLGGRSGLAGKVFRLWNRLEENLSRLRPRMQYNLADMPRFELFELKDNAYLRQERLSYLKDIDGIISARYLYLNASRAALSGKAKPVRIDLGKEFDCLIATAPINICTTNGKGLVQTVHDVIPLEYVPHLDHVVVFGKRLARAVDARKLFVSESTREKYEGLYGEPGGQGGSVITQMPSLQMPKSHARGLLRQEVIKPCRRAKSKNSELTPFRYLLFNSSVEPRKNLLFAIKAFRASGLAEEGIRLCVTGQLHKDPYSKAVAEQADDSVLLTGYIDENTKTSLFLHALGVLSPSLVEGFGIPVLDAACVGAQVIASPSGSHVEISKRFDFKKNIWLCDTVDPMEWSLAMKRLAAAEIARIECRDSERKRRLERFDMLEEKIFREFSCVVSEEVINSMQKAFK